MNKKWLFQRPIFELDDKGEAKSSTPIRYENEQVELEPWIWGVVYDDNTELHQFDDNGIFHQIGEVDQKRVKLFTLYEPNGMGDGRVDIFIPQGKEVALIHKYKNYIFAAGTQGEYRRRVPCFGYKLKGGHTHLNYIMPNGTIVQAFDDVEPNFGDIM